MMSLCHDWDSCWNHSFCPFPQWKHPLLCNPVHFCCANSNEDNGPTLVIHQILLEPCGNQSCTPRTFTIRVTGPSYPCGETFTLRAGSCTELDEPLVIAGLIPGQYEIEQLNTHCSCGCGCNEYDTTFTGPISCGQVSITASRVPTVITIVSRKRLCRRLNRSCWRTGCGWHNNCGC
ncbi:MAG: hypothetical protein IJ418_24005 [Clostridia bacterium]|nr:hypothetical protein [Clostridia bacterium]